MALAATDEYHFFHWELEFPEVFFGAAAGTTQAVGMKEHGGFDAVVGNPPYERIQTLDKYVASYSKKKYIAAAGSFDIYVLFLELGIGLLETEGRLGEIVP